MVLASFEGHLPGPVTEPAPPRRPGSVRRTSHLDVTRPEGGPFTWSTITGAARDLLTTASGPSVVGSGSLFAEIGADGTIERDAYEPTDTDHLDTLVGARPGFGFRSEAKDLLARLAGTPLGLLIDDLSGAPAASGYGAIRERVLLGLPDPPMPAAPVTGATRPDVCAGWRAGGLPDRSRSAGLPMPFEAEPPVAPPLVCADELAWHPMGALGVRQSRRIRRLDLWCEGDSLVVDAMFRDSTVDPDLTQRVVHEYALSAVVDARIMTVLEVHATPRALPFPTDCPLAAAGASTILGEAVDGLRSTVRLVSRGPGSCTHLNDLYRSLADVPALAAALGVTRGA